ncbi:hypothetical protein DMJ13_21330 [halophilic archaeon]|nr:hypothetical protein DMJ13_21330 [halophilic archaeon]
MAIRSDLLTYKLTNAALGWIVISVLLLTAIEYALSEQFLWAGMAVAVIAIALVPPALSRRPTEMIAWEVLALAAVPVVARSFNVLVGPATYLSVTALALIVAVELEAFTSVEMTPEFAVVFVVIVTMAIAGLWTIAQFVSDVYLGTTFLSGQTAVMWDLVIATGIGVIAGLIFEFYFRRISPSNKLSYEPWDDV